MKQTLLIITFLCFTATTAFADHHGTSSDHHHDATSDKSLEMMAAEAKAKAMDSKEATALVAFITTTDSMVAGHALHFAYHIAKSGRSVTLILIGEGGRIGISSEESPTSAVSNQSLRKDLSMLLEAGGKVYITPYTLGHFKAKPDQLVEGVSLPDNAKAIHDHMLATTTQLIVW